MNGFGLDGKLFRGLTKAGDFIILAVITVVFFLPVVTIGASLTAAFYSGIKLVRDEESHGNMGWNNALLICNAFKI